MIVFMATVDISGHKAFDTDPLWGCSENIVFWLLAKRISVKRFVT